jgi:hypothetical protein
VTHRACFSFAGLTCAMVMAASPLLAQTSPLLVPSPGPSTELEFRVKTTIEPRCGWSSSGTPAANVNLGSLEADGSFDVPFEIDCNTPFVFSTVSQNGHLSQDEMIEELPNSFTQKVDYRLALRLGVREADGSIATLTATCRSENLRIEGPCPFAQGSVSAIEFTGDAIAPSADTSLPRSRLRILWSAPQEGGPSRVAGRYSDVLTVSVSAKP